MRVALTACLLAACDTWPVDIVGPDVSATYAPELSCVLAADGSTYDLTDSLWTQLAPLEYVQEQCHDGNAWACTTCQYGECVASLPDFVDEPLRKQYAAHEYSHAVLTLLEQPHTHADAGFQRVVRQCSTVWY
jgi:hypothetical protein